MNERVIQQCEVMSDRELVIQRTIDSENFDQSFLDIVDSELKKRGLSVKGFINDVHVAQDDEEGESCTIDQGVEKIRSDFPLWSILTVTNCLDDVWVLQKEYNRWLVHHYADDVYVESFFYETEEQVKSMLKRFLALEEWTVDETHDLNRWRSVFQSRSPAFLIKVISDLGDILHTVKTPMFSQDQKGQLALLVPLDLEKEAKEKVAETQTKLEQLYDQTEHLAKVGDWEQELKIYDILSELVPDNLAVHYNRGQVYFEQDRLDEAAESLIEAIVLGLPEISGQVNLKSRGAGRIAGMVNPLLSLAMSALQSNSPGQVGYSDYLDDVELLLGNIHDQRPENIRALHGLAIIAEQKNETAEAVGHYRDMLVIEPQHEAAQAQIAYLEQADGDAR